MSSAAPPKPPPKADAFPPMPRPIPNMTPLPTPPAAPAQAAAAMSSAAAAAKAFAANLSYDHMTVLELVEACKSAEIRGYSKKKRAELIELLRGGSA